MAGLCVALVKDLRRDPLMLRAELGNQLMEQAVIAGVVEHGHEDFAIVLEPNEDSDSARAGADAARPPPGPPLPDPVPPVRRRKHRDGPRRNTPRRHTKAATRSPGPGGGLRAVRLRPTGRIRVPEVGHLVSGFGQYGASGPDVGRPCAGSGGARIRRVGWAFSPSSAAQEDFSGPTCCPSWQWAR